MICMNRMNIILLTLAIVFAISGIMQIKQIQTNISSMSTDQNTTHFTSLDSALSLMKTALEIENRNELIVYNADFKKPFKNITPAPPRRSPIRRVSTQVEPRREFQLRGILMRGSTPLAIIEDDSGETFIRAVGEKVHDHQIVEIMTNQVNLRDTQGTYTLTIETR